jgi:hypothetical protein
MSLKAGAVIERAVRTSAWGRLVLMSDPFGHGCCLVPFLGRGYDEIASQGMGLDPHGRRSQRPGSAEHS